jgi:hypothetical protein
MACKLRLGMSRDEIERELGKRRYSPAIGVSYYDSGATDKNGEPLGIIVDYKSRSVGVAENAVDTGKLVQYSVGPILE